MTVGELLKARKGAIHQKWLADALASYSEDAAKAFRREKDPFANPVGSSLRAATRAVLDALLGEVDAEQIEPHLHQIIKIRAVQQLTPSQALGFIFRLKEVIRAEVAQGAELRDGPGDSSAAREWAELEGRIDRIGLAAFDIYVRCREKISDLRVEEVKRRVSWILGKINSRGLDPELDRIDLE